MNRQRSPVTYRPFNIRNVLQEGQLPISYADGSAIRQTARAFEQLGHIAGEYGDRIALIEGERDGQAAAVAAAPESRVTSRPQDQTRIPVETSAQNNAGEASSGVSDVASFLKKRLVNADRGSDVDGLNGDFASRLSKLIEAAPDDVRDDIGLLSGFRSNERQEKLYQQALLKYGSEQAARKWVAAPGRSRHNHGNAYDLRYKSAAARAWVHANAGRFGLHFPMGHEPWHIEPVGSRARPSGSGGGSELPASNNGTSTINSEGSARLNLTNSSTIYGRAFDRAAVSSHLQNVDVALREDFERLYDAHPNDPALLAGKINELRDAYSRNALIDGYEGEFNRAFDRFANEKIRQAGRNQQRVLYEQDVDNFRSNLERIEEVKSRALATLDPGAEGIDQVFAEHQAAVDILYDDAVNRGLVKPSTAEQAKRKSRSESARIFYQRQIEGAGPVEIRAFREELRKDFKQGNLDDLDSATFLSLDNWLVSRARQAENEEKRLVSDIVRAGGDMAQRALIGIPVMAAEKNRLLFLADESPLKEVDGAVEAAIAKIDLAEAIRIKPIPEAIAELDEARRAAAKNPSKLSLDVLQFGEQALQGKQAALRNDPLSFAFGIGLIDEVTEIDPAAAPDTLTGQIGARLLQIEKISEDQGIPLPVFRSGEVRQLKQAFKDPQLAVHFAASVVQAAGNDAPRVLSELESDARDLFQAGAVLAGGGSSGAALDIIEGYRRNADGKMRKHLPNTARVQKVDEVIGSAIPRGARDRDRISQAAHAIARVRAEEEGVEVDSPEAEEIFERALHEAAGGIFDRGVQFGGFTSLDDGIFASGYRVLVPNTIRADRLGDLIDALTIDDLNGSELYPRLSNGEKYTERALSHAKLVSVPGGYWLALGNPESGSPRFMRGHDGSPYRLDLMEWRSVLEPRVPGAYR